MNKLTFNKKAPTRSQATHAKLVNRIGHWLALATAEERTDGLSWYYEAGAFCSALGKETGFKSDHVAQCVAILSPQVPWDSNKRNAALLATALTTEVSFFATEDQKTKALAALIGEYVLPVTARKTFSFAENISNPCSLRVTVDRHAVKVALNDLTADQVRITPLHYKRIEAAYCEVARNNGLLPYQVQAITWVTYKRVVNR